MEICVLHPSYDGSLSPCNGLDPDAVPELWLQPEHQVTSVKLHKATAVKQLIALTRRRARKDSLEDLAEVAAAPKALIEPQEFEFPLSGISATTASTTGTATSGSNPISPSSGSSASRSASSSSDSSTISASNAGDTDAAAASAPFDVFLNLCDGAWDEDRPGIEVVQALERLNAPFTGADARCYEPSKEEMKIVAVYHGVPTPPWRVCYDARDVAEAARVLRLPVIVKHASGYNSVGMTRDSKCASVEELQTQAGLMITSFGSAMLEEFIDGREFTVLVSEDPEADAAEHESDEAKAEEPGRHSEPEAGESTKPGGANKPGGITKPGGGSAAQSGVFVYAPVECGFPPGEEFKHFDLKWVEHEGLQWQRVEDKGMDEKLRSMAGTMFRALGGVGYGRLDIRADSEGNVYFLEMNPNCGIFYPPDQQGSADFILSLDPSNDHRSFLRRILLAAVKRWKRKQPSVLVKQCSPLPTTAGGVALSSAAAPAAPAASAASATASTAASAATNGSTPAASPASARPYTAPSFGLFAARDFTQGDTIERLEEGPVHLVTRQHVEREWSAQQQLWFRQYAWPVGSGVWAMWSPRAADWRPLNHSCDPNAWLDGLNVTARRRIGKGEQITVDYATFCVDSEPFECSCSSSKCRGKVTGEDYLAPWLSEEYGEHMSAQVLFLRSQARSPVTAAPQST